MQPGTVSPEPDRQILRYVPFQSKVTQGFWQGLSDLKLETLRLSEDPLDILGYFAPSNYENLSPQFQIDDESFRPILPASDTPAEAARRAQHEVPGTLHNLNSIERFAAFDKQAAQRAVNQQIWQDIRSGAAEAHPQLLQRFLLFTFADLKQFKYHYWFAFPALQPPAPFTLAQPIASLVNAMGPAVAQQVAAACQSWRERAHLQPQSNGSPGERHSAWLLLLAQDGSHVTHHPLNSWQQVQQEAARQQARVLLACDDPSASERFPGWPLRNLLLLAAVRWGIQEVGVVCVRCLRGPVSAQRCLYVHAHMPSLPPGWCEPDGCPSSIGWEVGPVPGKLGPRVAELASSMDPHALAQSAVNLNLGLMRWRAAPALDLERLTATRCLLLGAGTLGCAVARTLLGWGVNSMTLVDSGRVAYSNPVRQSLFTFEDSRGGATPKAQAAADSLRCIYPHVEAEGRQLTVPMPGHPLTPAELSQAEADAAELDALVAACDVVFLLMDTREARWLPTLLAAAHGKLAINAALAFDSFLVMRHGPPPIDAGFMTSREGHPRSGRGHSAQPHRLGCYFCSDVVAPVDSTVDRPLDQMCTVARPGLAPIAGALAVEVMAAVVQHPAGIHAPALDTSGTRFGGSGGPEEECSVLGPVPHRVHGRLSGFTQHCLIGQAFSQCTACSACVVERYKQEGWGFLQHALQDPKWLEDLTGLTEVQQQAAAAAERMDLNRVGSLGSLAASDEGSEGWNAL
ncbi:hypothetical protein WJX74_008120 [Apatococcus lobatus]|uniref:Ubiquitin-like modifier-activating enzyme ATG7 n=2 Tax=Apatococcus TaxID=904362 RepID=A0AAW1SP50_9CHLO